MDFEQVDLDREDLNQALKKSMGNDAIEISSEIHSQYNEVPFRVLVKPDADIRKLFRVFLDVSRPFRENYPTLSSTVSFNRADYDRRKVVSLAFVNGDELAYGPDQPLDIAEDEQASFGDSVFSSLREYSHMHPAAQNSTNFISFKENTAMTVPGENFPFPVVYDGLVVYFGSLEKVKVPHGLQADMARELKAALKEGGFSRSKEGNTEAGRVTVTDGDTKREFKVSLTLVKSGMEDYYQVDSIHEITP